MQKELQEKYDKIEPLITEYCDEHLDEEYKELCLKVLQKLSRKRPSPLLKGQANTWAAGIVHAIGSANFLFDQSQPIHTTAKELAADFGCSPSTSGNKASQIRKWFKIDYFNSDWILPSRMGDNPMLWYVEVNGLVMDARRLPRHLQELCYQKGLIPYIPADRGE